MTFKSLLLWLPFLPLSLTLAVFLWRRLWQERPFFFAYLGSALLAGLARFGSSQLDPLPRFYTYWISDMAISLAVFMAMYEVFLRRLFGGFGQVRIYRKVFSVAGFVILILAAFTAVEAHDRASAFLMASRGLDFIRTATLVFFLVLMLVMGRQWTRYDLGITLGFAIQAAAALANSAVGTLMHSRSGFLDSLEVVSYNISCLIWLFTFLKRESIDQPAPPDSLTRDSLAQARVWESMLKVWLGSEKGKR